MSKHRFSLCILALIVVLCLVHLLLPQMLLSYLNNKLKDMGDYRGHIEDIDLSWWRGAYRIDSMLIEKKNQQVRVPLFVSESIEIGVSWRTLWRKRVLVAEVMLDQPQLSFVDGKDENDTQTGDGINWRDRVQGLIPFRLNEIRVVNGRLAFHSFATDPEVHLYASDVQASLYNLTNSSKAESGRVASFEGTARLFGQSSIEATARFDPYTEWEDFELRLRVSDVDLTKLNDFSSAYANFDFAKGSGDLVMEVEANDSQLDGYIKPLLRNVEVFNFRQDIEAEDKGFFRGIWEALAGGGKEVLKNQSKDQFATRIAISGSTRDTDISAFQAFIEILRNAFVEAFTPRFERSLSEDDR